jgi:ethanolamine ammonia-lyase large subunit
MAQPDGTEVALSATKGGLRATVISLDAAGIATTKIRSIGLGPAKISSASSLLKSAETEVTFILPWAFALSAIVGGIVGAVAKRLKPKSTKLKLGPVMVDILAGLALGILGAAAYAIGVNLTDYVPQAKVGEALIFFVSGVISYMGRIPRKVAG